MEMKGNSTAPCPRPPHCQATGDRNLALAATSSQRFDGCVCHPAERFRLEIDRHPGEEVAAKRVVDLREGVARSERQGRDLLAGYWRLRIEDVVGA